VSWTTAEQQLAADLADAQAENRELREKLAERDTTITRLTELLDDAQEALWGVVGVLAGWAEKNPR